MAFQKCIAGGVAVALAFMASSGVTGQGGSNQTTPGELVVDHPTLINLGFEWVIEGDANRNAKVDVSYRKQGDTAWKIGLPLLRLQGERIVQENSWNVVSPNMFAGSILDLEPGTAYEARFVLSDPDGVAGPASGATRTQIVRTRPEPQPAADGRVFHVYPASYTGRKLEPSFEGIMCAYCYTCGGACRLDRDRPFGCPARRQVVRAFVRARDVHPSITRPAARPA